MWTAERYKEFKHLFEALEQGKQIQIDVGDGWWSTLDDPSFKASVENYRVKPDLELKVGDVFTFTVDSTGVEYLAIVRDNKDVLVAGKCNNTILYASHSYDTVINNIEEGIWTNVNFIV